MERSNCIAFSFFLFFIFLRIYESQSDSRFLQDDTKTAVVASALGACFFVGDLGMSGEYLTLSAVPTILCVEIALRGKNDCHMDGIIHPLCVRLIHFLRTRVV